MATSIERIFVWSGGGAFVASLAYCARTYLSTWSNGSAAGGWPAFFTDVALVSAFALHHSLLARNAPKRWIAHYVSDQLVRSVYVWTAASLLMLVCAAWQPIGYELYRSTGAAWWLHGAVQVTGVALIARAVATIDPLELAGIRTGPRNSGPASPLQATGPYRLVRHPVYLGWVLIMVGDAHLTGDRLLFAVLTTLYMAIAIPWEEQSLVAEFGDEYARYKQRVRWRIVPYIY
jgi:protein-S-isoprenylcysteine O-methyltransferase Ste14